MPLAEQGEGASASSKVKEVVNVAGAKLLQVPRAAHHRDRRQMKQFETWRPPELVESGLGDKAQSVENKGEMHARARERGRKNLRCQ